MDETCQYVTEWQLHQKGIQSYSSPLELCGRPAHFKDDLGSWWCAEHWDAHQAVGAKFIPFDDFEDDPF